MKELWDSSFEAIREKAATDGKVFAVVADEAHGSEASMASATLRQLLASDAAADLQEEGEADIEDSLAAQARHEGRLSALQRRPPSPLSGGVRVPLQ